MTVAFSPDTASLIACTALVTIGSAVQIAAGAGLSVVSGFALILWLGPGKAVPILLSLNLLVSVVATAFDGRGIQWIDAALAGGAILAGCLLASVTPVLPDQVLRLMTAAILVVVALPRPPRAPTPSNTTSATLGISFASLVTGALTVWTATPGPIIPLALARAGRSGMDIRRTMQPISTVGYGAALAWTGPSAFAAVGDRSFPFLVAATLIGIAAGYASRPWISADRVTQLIRLVAAIAAASLVASVLR